MLSIRPKILEISIGTSSGMDQWTKWCGPTRIFETSFEGGPLCLVGLSWSIGQKCPFSFDKIAALSTALLSPAYKINNQISGGLGRVCATTPLHVHVELLKFLTRIFVA